MHSNAKNNTPGRSSFSRLGEPLMNKISVDSNGSVYSQAQATSPRHAHLKNPTKILVPIEFANPSNSILNSLNSGFDKLKGFEKGLLSVAMQMKQIKEERTAALNSISIWVMSLFAAFCVLVTAIGAFLIGNRFVTVMVGELVLFLILGYLFAEAKKQEVGTRAQFKEMLNEIKIEAITIEVPDDATYGDYIEIKINEMKEYN
mmetsp:Transcript_28782/g.33231  ORF Transcript_28782/g.33231 Transcript_28782/m.33231 type:complete len:203 (+) Transcript_28782:58-666(+)